MDLRQIHVENVLFGPSLGRVWMSRSAEVKVTKDKKAFFGLSDACVRFVFGKTFLASSFEI